ncbi:MAG: hypothetical protein RIS47_2073 [Bacteroidota bacterium]|jgi:hypothetical protein
MVCRTHLPFRASKIHILDTANSTKTNETNPEIKKKTTIQATQIQYSKSEKSNSYENK